MSFNNSSNFVVGEATFINNENVTGMSELHYLYRHVAKGASHDSKDQYENPKCDPNTRNQLLNDIQEWIKVPNKETGITFLHGPAGSGKSCIARSVCEQGAKQGLLGASFFFWRGSTARNNERRLISTLAYQLAERNNDLSRIILNEVKQNPRIVDMPLDDQFQKLIFEPCSKISREKLPIRVIVIDGLDECLSEVKQNDILKILARAVRHEKFPLGFFLTSRPELHLQEALDSKEIIFSTKIISLTRVPGASQDIRTVLESGFIRILNDPRFKRAFKYVSRPWPTEECVNKLVQDSSGQFIYAETVLKFVSDPDNSPVSRLEILMDVQEHGDTSTESPLANLDRLYRQIMSRVRYPELTTKVLRYVIAIQGLNETEMLSGFPELRFSPCITRAILYNQNRLLLVVEQLLGLSEGMAYRSLNKLHSLISLNVGSESTRRNLKIGFYHKSFQDFLTTKYRSRNFYVEPVEHAHSEIAESCLKFMSLPMFETEAQHAGWLYSCFQWSIHDRLGNEKVDTSAYTAALQRFLLQLSYHLNIHKLNNALQTFGLLYEPYFHNLKVNGSLSWEDLVHAVNDMRKLSFIPFCNFSLSQHIEPYIYPALRNFLQSYNNDQQIKRLLLVHIFTSYMPFGHISEGATIKLLQGVGLVSNETDLISVPAQYTDLTQRLMDMTSKSKLLEFLETPEFSQTFYCTPKDFSSFYVTIVLSGIWRKYMLSFCMSWACGPKITATGPLMVCLNTEALEFYNDVSLNGSLKKYIEPYIFMFLCEKLQGSTESVVKAWERTFEKARSLHPWNFSWDTLPGGRLFYGAQGVKQAFRLRCEHQDSRFHVL